MFHKKFQKYLYLYRNGELSLKKKHKLEKHLRTCSLCEKEWRQIQNVDTKVNVSRITAPEPEDPDRLTRKVMSAVFQQDIVSTEKDKKYLFPRIFLWIDKPVFRFGLVVIVFLIIISFFLQESIILRKVTQLEEKVVFKSRQEELDTQSYLSKLAVKTVVDKRKISEDLKRVLVLDEYSAEEWILIRKELFEELLESQKMLKEMQGTLLDSILKAYPTVLSTLEQKTKDKPRIQVIRREMSRILRML
jgi:hypothetical protein